MSTFNFNDESFKESELYKNYILENPAIGRLKVRASLANAAVPVSDVKIVVSKSIGEDTIIFFEGQTDSSGMINNIQLPTPKKNTDDEIIPKAATYDIEAIYSPDNLDSIYPITVYADICIVQYINIVPNSNLEMRDNFGN